MGLGMVGCAGPASRARHWLTAVWLTSDGPGLGMVEWGHSFALSEQYCAGHHGDFRPEPS
jgi:hypothetical protein